MFATNWQLIWIAKIILWASSELGSNKIENFKLPYLLILINEIINGLWFLRCIISSEIITTWIFTLLLLEEIGFVKIKGIWDAADFNPLQWLEIK
jgi:hypothetical protein